MSLAVVLLVVTIIELARYGQNNTFKKYRREVILSLAVSRAVSEGLQGKNFHVSSLILLSFSYPLTREINTLTLGLMFVTIKLASKCTTLSWTFITRQFSQFQFTQFHSYSFKTFSGL